MSDPTRPDHYYHDSLGDPASCTGDHPEPETDDPRFSGLSARTVDTAKTAKCSACGVTVVEDASIAGTVMFSYYFPASGAKVRGILCGVHGLALRKLLHPQIVGMAAYEETKRQLMEAWGRASS